MLCPSCGQDNPLTSAFCDSCGASFDVPDISPEIYSENADLRAVVKGPDFVGRKGEMNALDTALAGQGQVVMLAGDPGIGKTRHCPGDVRHCRNARRRGLLGPLL